MPNDNARAGVPCDNCGRPAPVNQAACDECIDYRTMQQEDAEMPDEARTPVTPQRTDGWYWIKWKELGGNGEWAACYSLEGEWIHPQGWTAQVVGPRIPDPDQLERNAEVLAAARDLLFSMQCRNSYDFQNERKALRSALAALGEGPREGNNGKD